MYLFNVDVGNCAWTFVYVYYCMVVLLIIFTIKTIFLAGTARLW